MMVSLTSLLLAILLAAAPGVQGLRIEAIGSVRHPSVLKALAISPDSRKVFTARDDGWLAVYSLETRKPLGVGLRFSGEVSDLALNSRGDQLAVAWGAEAVTILDPETLNVVTSVRLRDGAERLVFAPDSQTLLVATFSGRLAKLKASNLSIEREIVPTEGSRVLALTCSRDGKIVAMSDREGQIKLWSADSLEALRAWKAHDRFATVLEFDPPGRHLVSGGEEGDLKVWRLGDLSLAKESQDYHQQSIRCIAFSPDGRLVTGGYDGLTQFWDGKTFQAGRSYPNYRGYITACSISRDGRWLVRGGTSLDFVPMDRPEEFERAAEYGGAILGLAVAPDSRRFVTCGLDRRLYLWHVQERVATRGALLEDWGTSLDFCREGRSVAVALANGKVEIYSADALQRTMSWSAHKGPVTGIASVDGKLVSIGDDTAISIWGLDGNRLKTHDGKSPCRSIAVHGNRFAVGTADGAISIYDTFSDTPVKQIQGRPLSVTALEFSRDGARLLAGYFDGTLESFDIQSCAVIKSRRGNGSSILSIGASPSDDLIAVGFRDGFVRLFDVGSLREGASVQPRPAREIFAVRWVLGEHIFAGAGASNSVIFERLVGDVEAWRNRVR
jgi:WD40 repeat protein